MSECKPCKESETCDMCHGTGIVRYEGAMEILKDYDENPEKCVYCNGTGKYTYCGG